MSHSFENPPKSSFDTYLFGVGSYLFLMAEKYLLVTNEIENTSFGTNLINLYNNFTDVQGFFTVKGIRLAGRFAREIVSKISRKNLEDVVTQPGSQDC